MHFLPFFPSKHHRGDTISTIGPRSPAPGVQVPHSSVPVTTNQGRLRQLERFPISSPALLFFLVYQLRWSCHSNSKKSLISSLNWSKNPKQVKKKAFKLPKKHEQYKAPASASPRGSLCHLKHNKGTRGKGFLLDKRGFYPKKTPTPCAHIPSFVQHYRGKTKAFSSRTSAKRNLVV